MAPFFILIGLFAILTIVGKIGYQPLKFLKNNGIISTAIMFLFTGITHFTDMKYDYAAMIPKPLPNDLWVIYLTGLFEIAGAVGLLISRTRRLAAICLITLLIAMFPANIHAAIQEITFQGRAATSLLIRTPIQIFFIWILCWSSLKK